MKKKKVNISISIDKKLNSYIDELISNKSKYLEYLIYEDLIKNEYIKQELEKIIL
jgi:hypothetical protein